ncbi:hypothetical protein [Salmonirosea aquatica]|uniref:DUF3575 domain-containing protein n=1 Tax=Salmonirosea aquatica TaxID=2654236 RepID=A0A7C9BDT3_9BACT|nr:hypothetical protein [Cytophagaceae bacterium SJW1-29]
MFPKVFILLCAFFMATPGLAQTRYTPVIRAYSFEAFGASPGVQFALETPFRYRKSSFLNIHAGLGLYEQAASVSTAQHAYSLGTGLTYCYLLNRRKTSCDPRPEQHRWEYYLETGLAGTLFPDRYRLPDRNNRVVTVAAQLLAGLRIHYVGTRKVQTIKLRYSPFLASGFPPWAGIAYGIGLW